MTTRFDTLSNGFAIFIVRRLYHLYRQTHSDIQSSGQILTTRLDRVIVLPPVSIDTLKCSKQWTNTTRLNLVMVLPSLSLRHIQIFKSMDEYGDKTQSSDGFAIFIVTDTLKCSTQRTNMATRLNGME